MGSVEDRLRRLEAREELGRAYRPGPSAEALERMIDLLDRYAAAKWRGDVSPELEREFRQAAEAVERRRNRGGLSE